MERGKNEGPQIGFVIQKFPEFPKFRIDRGKKLFCSPPTFQKFQSSSRIKIIIIFENSLRLLQPNSNPNPKPIHSIQSKAKEKKPGVIFQALKSEI